MARPSSVDEHALLLRLMAEFRRVGYAGASLGGLAEAAGLKKASLYHRFPDGKAQMAREVLAAADRSLEQHILAALRDGGSPATRLQAMAAEVDRFYDGGRQACLLNVLASPMGDNGPFDEMVRESFAKWLEALSATFEDAGFAEDAARHRAQRVIALVEGGLVMARGLGDTTPFRVSLESVTAELTR